ncbi:hypothetical protein D9M71_192360 [compost metagenome]
MLVAEGGELVHRATQVQGAGRFQGGHQHAFFRIEDLGRLTHESHAGNDHGLRRMLIAETGHFQGVGNAAAGFLGQSLDHRIAVVVGDQHGIARLQFGGNGGTVMRLLLGRQLFGLLGGKMGLDQKAFGKLCHGS